MLESPVKLSNTKSLVVPLFVEVVFDLLIFIVLASAFPSASTAITCLTLSDYFIFRLPSVSIDNSIPATAVSD